MADTRELNARFAIREHLTVVDGPGGLPMVEVRNRHSTATIALQGAQVLRWAPDDARSVLWLSEQSHFAAGKAIRGGVPICWPWFGPHPANAALPAHGFARTAQWTLDDTAAGPDGATVVRLSLADDARTRELWPHAFRLELTVTVGPALDIALAVHNGSAEPWSYTGALHSYFAVGDVREITLHGLSGTAYLDQLQGMQRLVQNGPITIEEEVDRIYVDTLATCEIGDPQLGRRISVAKDGSRTTVVWNPWIDKAARMADFGDREYLAMVCVETANAADDRVVVAPGATAHLRATFSVSALS